MEVLLETLKLMNGNSKDSGGSAGTLLKNIATAVKPSPYFSPSFTSFDLTAESDRYSRFLRIIKAHSVSETKIAQIFLTNPIVLVNKLRQSLAIQ